MNRRRFVTLAPALAASLPLSAQSQSQSQSQPQPQPLLRRRLGRLGDTVPIIGLGTWLTFDVGDDPDEAAQRGEVLQRFFAAGGGLIDSSPMYGRAERLLGELLARLPHAGRLVAESKVWTPLDSLGPGQLERSLRLWGLPRFDVLLVHNLLNWRAHLKTLRRWQEEGRVRHIGVSTSHGQKHEEAERILRSERLDVLQITYNFADTRAEGLMRLAAERGLSVIINRPFDGGDLFDRVGRRTLPPWAAELDCANWAQYFLKWVVSHPAVTCAIPATRRPEHLDENMGAAVGRLPGAAARERMQAYIARM
jgi:aryl-alcohol dehydrogenase-like predicted oxidoreductase